MMGLKHREKQRKAEGLDSSLCWNDREREGRSASACTESACTGNACTEGGE